MSAESRKRFLWIWNCIVMFSMVIYAVVPTSVRAQSLPSYAFPRIYVGLDDMISAEFWTLGSTLTFTVDNDADPANGYIFRGSKLVDDTVQELPELGIVNFKLWRIDPSLDIVPDQYVTVSDGITTKVMHVMPATFDYANEQTDVAGGRGPAGLTTSVSIMTDRGDISMTVVIDQNGNWTADFGAKGFDIRNVDRATVDVYDEDGDSTVARLPYPITFGVRPETEDVEGWEWPVHQMVTIQVDDPKTDQNPDRIATNMPNWVEGQLGRTLLTVNFDDYDLKTGDIVTVSNGTTTKQHIVRKLAMTDVDLNAEKLLGTADAGQRLNTLACWQGFCAYREEWADQNGNWLANYAVPGDRPFEQDLGDIRPGSWVDSTVTDDDGDVTQAGRRIPNPTFSAWANDNYIEGYGWDLGKTITLTINDPATSANPDYSSSTTVASVEWDPNQTWWNFDLNPYDLKADDVVTASDGTYTKQLTVTDINITNTNLDMDTVQGTASPNQLVTVSVCGADPCIFRDAYADGSGNWSAKFGVPGSNDWEQETIDLTYGLWISATAWDEDEDSSMSGYTVDWVAPPSIPAVFAISTAPDLTVPRATVESISLLNTLNESLFRIDNEGVLQPLAATSYSVSPDGLVYTVALRPNALWSDGMPVTAQHFVDGILRVLDPSVGSDYGFLLFSIRNAKAFHDGDITDRSLVGVKALNNETLQITLGRPTSHFPQILATPIMLPARQDIIDQYGDSWTSPAHYVSNGLFKLLELDSAHAVVEQNPAYNGPMQAGFSKIGFDVIADEQEAIQAYKNGDVDVLLSISMASIMSDPALRRDLAILPDPGVQYVGFSTQVTPTNNPLVRKALASAINRQFIVDDVLQTSWRPEATGIIPPELPGYQGSSVGYSYDPAQAQALLAQAGYPGGQGFPTLKLLASPAQSELVEEIASKWRSVLGITVNIDYVEGGDRYQTLSSCRQNPTSCPYNGYISGWLIDYPDAYNFINDLFNPESPYNYTGWDNASYRNLIDLSVSEPNPAQRIAYLQQAEKVLVEDEAAVAPLFHLDMGLVIRPGIFPYYSSAFYSNLAYWSDVDPGGDGMTAAVIGSDGGTIATENSTVSAEVPAGALANDVNLSVTDLGGNYQITATQEELNVISGFSIQPHGLQFSTPVTLTFAWNDANNDGRVDGTNEPETNIFLLKDGVQIAPACGINPNCDMAANVLTVQVSRLSHFELVAPSNQAPTNVIITAPVDPVAITNSVTVRVAFTDLGDLEPHNVKIEWGDAATTVVTITGANTAVLHQYTSPGVYTVTATVTDSAGESAQSIFQYIVIYDPDGGFVTGGGWINSSAGAYTPDPTLTGKATFGFVSKYQTGANVPAGNTEFQFKVANLNFTSTSYEWLVVAGTKAQYKGTGTINGAGNFGFLLTAMDGAPDQFRIKIWDKPSGNVIYDNQLGASDTANPTTVIQGGSIVVHKTK